MLSYENKNRSEIKNHFRKTQLSKDHQFPLFLTKLFRTMNKIPKYSLLSAFGEQLPQSYLPSELALALALDKSGIFTDFEFEKEQAIGTHLLVWVVTISGPGKVEARKIRDLTAKTKPFFRVGPRRKVEEELKRRSLSLLKLENWAKGRNRNQGLTYDRDRLEKMTARLEMLIGTRFEKMKRNESYSACPLKARERISAKFPELSSVRLRHELYAEILNWRISLDLPSNFPIKNFKLVRPTDIKKWIYKP